MSPSQTQTLALLQAAETDLLGEATPLQPPPVPTPTPFPKASDAEDDKNERAKSKPAEDENQPGFIGELNLPYP